MGKKELIVDPSLYDLDRPIADIEEIRKQNPQRFEMEQLTAIAYMNPDDLTCVGYKELTENEFWVRGHMPGMPIMPGVIMCEAAAQLMSYFCRSQNLIADDAVLGFAGLENVRFRGVVPPGNRFVIQAKQIKIKRILVADFQCLIEDNLVCEGTIKGIPLPVDTEAIRVAAGLE